MAKIVITIEDIEDGKIKFNANPSIATILFKQKEFGSISSAEGYAILLARKILESSRDQDPDPKSKIVVPDYSR